MIDHISPDLYGILIDRVPIVCVDVIVRNKKGEYLLVQRNNEPLKGEWWVVGGRLLRGETLADGARRKCLEEAGIKVDELNLEGAYEEVFTKCPWNESGIHTVSFVYSASIRSGHIRLDNQSSDWKYCRNLPSRFVKYLKQFRV